MFKIPTLGNSVKLELQETCLEFTVIDSNTVVTILESVEKDKEDVVYDAYVNHYVKELIHPY